MGEIADMMIEGDMCPCGEFLFGGGDGYPRFCSQECAKDYGGDPARAPKPPRTAVDGFWRLILDAVVAGAHRVPDIAALLETDGAAVSNAVGRMVGAGLLHRPSNDTVAVTKRAKRQMTGAA